MRKTQRKTMEREKEMTGIVTKYLREIVKGRVADPVGSGSYRYFGNVKVV